MSTTTLKPDYNFKYFLLLMQSVLNSAPVNKAEEPVNWQTVYEIAVDHSLAGMLYYAIEKLPDEDKPQGEFMPYLEQMYREQIVADLNLSLETERILQLLSSQGIRCMPVKGIVTKADYPQPHLRTMTDVDILCRAEERLAVEKIFLENGYERENVGVKDSSFRKDEILHFEMHNSLLTEASPAYKYFQDIWDRALFRENSLVANMSLEDTYIFMLEHLARHTEFGGAGIRMFMDVYAFLKKHEGDLDRNYTDKVLSEILLSDFEKQAVSISRNWFSGEEEIDYNSPNAEFILNSCTFGRTNVAMTSDTIKNYKGSSSARNGIKRILKKLFPALKWMRLRYKAVDKCPLLYIAFVPVHWVDRLIVRHDIKTLNVRGYFINDSSEEAAELRKIFASLGLEKRI